MHRDLTAPVSDRRTPAVHTGDSLEVALREERAVWGLTLPATIALLSAPVLIVATGVALALTDRALFFDLTLEDHVVEWSQFGALMVAVVAGALLTVRLRALGDRRLALAAALATVAVFVVAGEEISWGQRILGLTTPEALEAINIQDETNLHNIGVLQGINRLGQVALAGLGATVPVLVVALRRSLPALDRLFIPPLAFSLWFAPLALYWFVRLPITPDETISRFSEVPELTFYTGLAGVALLNLWRVSRETAAHEPGNPPA